MGFIVLIDLIRCNVEFSAILFVEKNTKLNTIKNLNACYSFVYSMLEGKVRIRKHFEKLISGTYEMYQCPEVTDNVLKIWLAVLLVFIIFNLDYASMT